MSHLREARAVEVPVWRVLVHRRVLLHFFSGELCHVSVLEGIRHHQRPG